MWLFTRLSYLPTRLKPKAGQNLWNSRIFRQKSGHSIKNYQASRQTSAHNHCKKALTFCNLHISLGREHIMKCAPAYKQHTCTYHWLVWHQRCCTYLRQLGPSWELRTVLQSYLLLVLWRQTLSTAASPFVAQTTSQIHNLMHLAVQSESLCSLQTLSLTRHWCWGRRFFY